MPTDLLPLELRRVLDVLPDDFGTVPGHPRRGRCIEATLIFTTVARRLGIPAKALACDVTAFNAVAWELASAGIKDRDTWVERSGYTLQMRCDDNDGVSMFSEPYRKSGFSGHLLVAGDGWFLDPTAEQFHRPDHGIPVPSAALIGPYDPAEEGSQLRLDDGALIQWVWRPEVKRWRTTPAWRQGVPRDVLDLLVIAATIEAPDAPMSDTQLDERLAFPHA